MFDIDYLTDSMNYIPVSLDNQSNLHASTSEVTNSAGTLQSPNANASKEADEDEELIVVPTVIKHSIAKKYKRRKSSKEFVGTGLDFEEVKFAFEKVNTAGIRVSLPSPDRGRREGKAPMTEKDETQASRKTKEQILQEEAGLAEAIRLDALEKALEKEEVAKQAQVQFEAQSYNEEDWDTIRAKLEANAELKESVLGKDLTIEDYAKRMRFGEELQTKTAKKLKFDDEDEEVYVSQPLGFVDPDHPKKVYKVVKALYGLHQAPRAWYATLPTFLEEHGYRRGTVDKTLFIKKDKKDIILVQISNKFYGELDSSLDCKVTPKTSHLNAVKRIFKYLKGKPNLGLWYPRESSFDLEAYSDSDYARANLDRKSITGGCQFLGSRLISWQCKKQTIVATSTTEAEYVAAASCCGQVLWIQNQMLDYGFNFMNTKIHIDNESTICIVKNPVYHSKTKHIEIRHHFIRDSYEKKLIRVEKIHTDFNVADLLTKAFDGPRFNFLVVNIGYTWIALEHGLELN
ncbi:putative ribonuclease H-like domain-containing protein [Tanacetum coccineum]